MLKHVKTLEGHQNPVYSLEKFNNKDLFFSAGNDRGVVEWSLEKMSFQKVITPVYSSVYSLLFNDDKLYIGQRSGNIDVYDFNTKSIIYKLNKHVKAVFDIKPLKDRKKIISVSEDGSISIWSSITGEHIHTLASVNTVIRCLAISNDESEFAIGCKDNIIRVYSTENYKLKKELSGHTMPITSLAYHANGKYLLSGSRDAQLKVWELLTYIESKSIPAHLFSIYSIAFHPVLPYFATCSQDKTIKIWNSKNYKLVKILSLEKLNVGHTHSINKIIWNETGEYLISTGDDRTINLWSFE